MWLMQSRRKIHITRTMSTVTWRHNNDDDVDDDDNNNIYNAQIS